MHFTQNKLDLKKSMRQNSSETCEGLMALLPIGSMCPGEYSIQHSMNQHRNSLKRVLKCENLINQIDLVARLESFRSQKWSTINCPYNDLLENKCCLYNTVEGRILHNIVHPTCQALKGALSGLQNLLKHG